MAKRVLTYMFILFLFASCGKKEITGYTISGKVGNETCRMLIAGLNDKFEKVDSIVTDKTGQFTYTIDNGSVVPLLLFLPDGKQKTLFAEPGVTAELSYDSTGTERWIVTGGPVQTAHDSISLKIEKCTDKEKRIELIEDFIKRNPMDETCIELIRRYMIDVPGQDNAKIRSTISKLSGILQDHEYIAITKKKIDGRTHNTLHKLFPSFTYTTADSCQKVTLTSFSQKHFLVTFWASWDNASRKKMKALSIIDDSIKSKNFAILNIALEYDTIAWKEIVTNDSIAGCNVCESKAFNSEIASKFDIDSLPYSILVSPYQRVLRYKVDLEKDITLIDSLTKKHDKTIEERKKKEEREKEKLKKKKNKKTK